MFTRLTETADTPTSFRSAGTQRSIRTGVLSLVIALIALLSWAPEASAYESYHDPNLDDQGYCSACHPGFTGGRSDVTHALHTGGTDPVTTTCDLCHTGSGRDNPLTMWSTGNNLGCVGCHGRDYGETIQANYRTFTIAGLPKSSGYGLRRHHANAGIGVCADCHADVTPLPENVSPEYYARTDVSLGGAPVDPCSNEDTANDADALGLDNDGDLLYEGADPDCAANNAPVATDDAYATDEDVTLNVPAPGVLGNDSDADGDALTAVLDTTTANGTLTLNGDGSFSYVPNLNFNGTDSFTYVANDGAADSNVATVTITVNAVNDAPVADPNGPYTGTAGVAVLFDGTGSSDVDGTIVTYAWDFGDGNAGTGPTPSHTYAAAGTYTVALTVTDNGTPALSDTATTTATIAAAPNVPPVATDDAYATDEDVTLNVPAPGVLGNDSDADGDALTAVLDTTTANGTLTLNGDGSFSYVPNLNFNGTDSFTYVANDGADNSNVATVTITVNGVNDAPVAADDAYVTDEDTVLDVPAPGVLANDVDVDGDGLAAFLIAGPANGGVLLNTDGSFSYTPNLGFFGSDSFTYVANDGAVDSNVATVSITVNALDPDINLNPKSLVFGDTVIGTSKDLTTQIENLGGDDLVVDGIEPCIGTSAEFGWSLVPPITVAPSGSQALTVTYTPLDLGPDSGCLEISSNDPDEPIVELALSGTGVDAPQLDLDIVGFKVNKRFSLTKGRDAIGITLTVKNDGAINSQTRPATVIGVQNGDQVYGETLPVSDAVGDGRSRFDFPSFTPTELGDITWTATIADDDPDIDTATAVTRVVP